MKEKTRKFYKVAGLVIVLIAVFVTGYNFGRSNEPELNKVVGLVDLENGKPEDVDFSAFWKTWNVINEKFVPVTSSTTKAVNSQDKVWGAIMGLASSLGDPYTVFFDPEEAKDFEAEISGQFEGVGMELGIRDNQLTVVAPLKDTPAERAGVKAGDRILEINGLPAINISVDAAVKKIRGKKGTEVELVLQREESGTITVKIVRDVINIPIINTEMKKVTADGHVEKITGLRSDGVFVIRLYSFTSTSPNLFRGALRDFIVSGSNKLIIDLRSNPGGYLEAAVDMASWFLPAGKIVVTEEYANNEQNQIYRSRGYDIFSKNLKMVILLDAGSASASEIFAGAMQEYGLAKIVGTKSFGKGSVQELVPITDDTALKVTVARWLTPNGRSISDSGLEPDYEVKVTAEEIAEGKDPQMDKAVEILNQ